MSFKTLSYEALSIILVTILSLASCSTPVGYNSRQIASESSAIAITLRQSLPKLTTDKGELLLALKQAMKNRTKGKTDAELTASSEKIRDYLFFLGLTAKDLKKAESTVISNDDLSPVKKPLPIIIKKVAENEVFDESDTGGEEEDKTPSNLRAILRLFISSTQFLDCASMVDWECLEKSPEIKPTSEFRLERSDFSSPVRAGEFLDMDVYFTAGWDGSPKAGLADRFAEKINSDADKKLFLAMYGIDDIAGSMSSVYKAIIDRANSPQTEVKAVVDVMGVERGGGPWIFNYPTEEEINQQNIFSISKNLETPEGMHLTFQYSGTANFLREMNQGIKTQKAARARIEWPFARIMHNKFAVMENKNGEKSVWTGTANISKNCMGVEANANMAIYIRNNLIADAFTEQFNLMFSFDESIKVKSKIVISESETQPISVGRFHRAKFPINKRFFTFEDGTKVRVHFAPTDDAEHRVIIPMLLSASSGDEIRISMFGGTGFEIVRAMQYAAARGANVKIAFDRRLGHGLTSWIRDAVLNVNMPNPYIGKTGYTGSPGKISYRVSTWTGKNHYKAGTLSRKLQDGSYRAEQIIVGSQNWSSGGNDYNDENLVSIQNLNQDVESAAMFNHEFDTRLWPKSKEERPKI